MDEFQFIKSIKQKTYHQHSLIKGIGDDAAVFRDTTHDIVTAVDTFVDKIHFSKQTTQPFHIGYRALAANISDMAAMGAIPKFYLVSIVIPKNVGEKSLQSIFTGMRKIASLYKMDLIGGDTVSGSVLTISITIIGYVPKGKARYRSDAKDKDVVFVTGTLGDSRAGLHILMNNIDASFTHYFIKRHQMPTPRVTFAESLRPLKRVSLNDVSDGIANELREIAEASKVTIMIKDQEIPVSEHFSQFSRTQQYEWKYFGGEDFELVGTVPKQDWPIVKENAKKLMLRISKIGYVTYNEQLNGQVYVKKNNKIKLLNTFGYIHLK